MPMGVSSITHNRAKDILIKPYLFKLIVSSPTDPDYTGNKHLNSDKSDTRPCACTAPAPGNMTPQLK